MAKENGIDGRTNWLTMDIWDKQNYRYWVLWLCPHVRFLDYIKVKQAEREQAKELFGTTDEPTELANTVCFLAPESKPAMSDRYANLLFTHKQIKGIKTKTFDVGAGAGANGAAGSGPGSKLARLKLTDKEKRKLQDLIKKADSLEEIIRLEKALNEGRLPPGIIAEDDDEVMEG